VRRWAVGQNATCRSASGEEKVAEPAVDDNDVEEVADDDRAEHPFLKEEEEDDEGRALVTQAHHLR
jgi:hypothetical protein